ncbi:MAG: class I SAM-dependent methyltransferase [Elusimicrobiales bacterium]|jgi:SAM-dependent methyltransferase
MKTYEMIKTIYHSAFFSFFIPTFLTEFRREVNGSGRVLDLGCGPSSPLQYCDVGFSIGVEAFAPYLEKSKKQGIHSEYIASRIEDVEFPPRSFDIVIMSEVLEHLPDELGLRMLKKAEGWAVKKVIISSPNGFIPQKELDGNSLQKHLSGWNYARMRKLGFKCRGLAGLKVLRQEVESETMGDDLTSSMRFWPKSFWFVIAALSQMITYYMPFLAFELFCVKNLADE